MDAFTKNSQAELPYHGECTDLAAQPKLQCTAENCKDRNIYEGEEYYHIDDEIICENCFDDYKADWRREA